MLHPSGSSTMMLLVRRCFVQRELAVRLKHTCDQRHRYSDYTELRRPRFISSGNPCKALEALRSVQSLHVTRPSRLRVAFVRVPVLARRAQIWRAELKTCRVPGCNEITTKYAAHCTTHKAILRRHGDPLQDGVTKSQLQPYVKLVEARIAMEFAPRRVIGVVTLTPSHVDDVPF